MSVICKVYGVVDIATALILFFSQIPLPDIIKMPIIIILLFKGIPSLFG